MTPLRVEIFDGPLRFHVHSETQGDEPPYLVDLAPYQGTGLCSCQHFAMRLEPRLARGELGLRCKHIEQARNYLIDKVIMKLSAGEKETAGGLKANMTQRDINAHFGENRKEPDTFKQPEEEVHHAF